MIAISIQVGEDAGDIGQEFDISSLILVSAYAAKFPRPVKSDFFCRGQKVITAIPCALVRIAETIAGFSPIGERRIYMGLTV